MFNLLRFGKNSGCGVWSVVVWRGVALWEYDGLCGFMIMRYWRVSVWHFIFLISHQLTEPLWHFPLRDGGPPASHWLWWSLWAGSVILTAPVSLRRRRLRPTESDGWSWTVGLSLCPSLSQSGSHHCHHSLHCQPLPRWTQHSEAGVTSDTTRSWQTQHLRRSRKNISLNIKYCATLPGAVRTWFSGNLKTK